MNISENVNQFRTISKFRKCTFGIAFASAILIGSLISVPYFSADSSNAIENFAGDATLSLVPAEGILPVDVSAGLFSAGITTVSASTTATQGYVLSMNTLDDDNALTLKTSSDKSIPSITSDTQKEQFTDNTWGYSLDDNIYHQVPTSLSDATARKLAETSSKTSSTPDTYDVYFGAKFDGTKDLGEWSKSMVFSLVSKAPAAPDYMQDMNYNTCQSLTPERQYLIKDKRDEKVYSIAKLADGNCWMTQNLDLNIPASGLSATDTDIITDWNSSSDYKPTATLTNASQYTDSTATTTASWDAGDYYYNGSSSTSCGSGKTSYSGCTGFSTTGSSHYHVGNMYAWNAATAGTGGDLTSGEAPGSICPKGWRLPASSGNPSYANLQSAGSIGSTVQNWINDPYYFVRGGDLWYNNNKLLNAGDVGFYWESTPTSGSNNANVLLFSGASEVNTAYGNARAVAGSVRCVAREMLQRTITYNANGGTGGPGVITAMMDKNTVLSDTTPTSTDPQKPGFLGWSTDPSATTAEYKAGDPFTFPDSATTATLYAVYIGYHVNYNANGGTGAPASIISPVPTVTLSTTEPVTPDATNKPFFLGWATSQSSTTVDFVAGATYTFPDGQDTLTLYAVYGKRSITYNANGGTGAPGETISKDMTVAISTTRPTRDHYTFLGWATTETASTAQYQPGDTYNFSGGPSNVTLYAVWQATMRTVTISRNNNSYGSVSPSSVSKQDGSAITISGNTVKIGDTTVTATPAETTAQYTFAFSSWTNNCGSTLTGDCTITANFTATTNNYTVTISAGSNGSVNQTSLTVPYNSSASTSGSTATINGTKVTATPNSDYEVDKWTNNCGSKVTKNCTISVTFKKKTCLIEGTIVNLPNGETKPIEKLEDWEEVMGWDFETGQAVGALVTPIDKDTEPKEYDVVYLNFSDGKRIGYVDEHWFFDKAVMEYVEFNTENAEDYIGHEFVKMDGNGGYTTNTLVSVDRVREVTTTYSPTTYQHVNFIADDMLTMAADLKGLVNYFEVDPKTMAWDPEKKAADIRLYGLTTLEDFDGKIDQQAFDAFNVRYFNVSIGKGLMTWDTVDYYIDKYLPNLYMDRSQEKQEEKHDDPPVLNQIFNFITSIFN